MPNFGLQINVFNSHYDKLIKTVNLPTLTNIDPANDMVVSQHIFGEFIYIVTVKALILMTRDRFTYLAHLELEGGSAPIKTLVEGMTMSESLELS